MSENQKQSSTEMTKINDQKENQETQQQQSTLQTAQKQQTVQSNLFKALTSDKPDDLVIISLLRNKEEVAEIEKDIGKLNNKSYNNQLSKIAETLGSLGIRIENNHNMVGQVIKDKIEDLIIAIRRQYASNSVKYSNEQKKLKLEIERQKKEEERKEAEVTFDNIREDAYIEELVNRLKNNQWSKAELNINGEKINLNKEISELPEKSQRYLLTKALKKIYNNNNENGNNLQQELGLDNNNFTNLIIATVNNNFDRYQKLFAEKQPKQKTINLADITKNIVNTNKIGQDQEQTKKPINFQQLVTQRTKLFQDKLNEEGAEACRTYYKNNLDNSKKEHELDVLALNELMIGTEEQQNIYNKIASRVFIHGTYGQIKNDQNKLYSLNELTKDYWNFIGIDAFEISKKPKNIKVNDISDIINELPNTKEAQEALKFLCEQQFRNENCLKEKDKWPGNMLNVVLENMRSDAFRDITILKDAINEENMSSADKSFSLTKPTEDDTLYFKIIYSHSSEEVKKELMKDLEKKDSYFKKQFSRLSSEKQEDLINFIEITRKEKEGITKNEKETNNKILNTLIPLNENKKIKEKEQEEQSPEGYLSESETSEMTNNIISGNEEIVFGVKEAKIDLKDKASNPYFLADEKGHLYKNKENILDKQTFNLQDSFLGLVCAKNRAFALTDWGKSINMLDVKDGKKLNKNERFTPEQVRNQQKATQAAKEAIQRAGGDLKTVQKHTMPLLKNKEFVFYRKVGKGDNAQLKPLLLSDAVKVCLKVLKKKQEQAVGITKGKIEEKSTLDQICDMLKITDDSEGQFTPKELEEVKKAISMQIIATNVFVETFQGKNTALTEKLENERKQVVQKRQTTEQDRVEQQSADNVRGGLQGFSNGQPQKTPQQKITVDVTAEDFRKTQKQQEQNKTKSQNDTRPSTPITANKYTEQTLADQHAAFAIQAAAIAKKRAEKKELDKKNKDKQSILGQESEQSQQNGTPVSQEVQAEPSAEQPQQKTTVNVDANKYFDKQVEKQKEDENQSKDTSLNGPEEDSRSSTPASKESSTELGNKPIYFEDHPELQPNIQANNRQSSITNSFARVGLAQEELDNGSRSPGGILTNTSARTKNTKQSEILNF